ncbi:hypothetical protein ACFVP8_16150 [Viridibacillus arvi]|uniref:hypothetical protein n=1 Tax=Viridibacillus arvi TaxID=263475 RepID=UPI0036AD9E8B
MFWAIKCTNFNIRACTLDLKITIEGKNQFLGYLTNKIKNYPIFINYIPNKLLWKTYYEPSITTYNESRLFAHVLTINQDINLKLPMKVMKSNRDTKHLQQQLSSIINEWLMEEYENYTESNALAYYP